MSAVLGSLTPLAHRASPTHKVSRFQPPTHNAKNVESLSGLYSDRAVKIYLGQCEELGAVLGGATDAVVTQRLALKLVTESRPDLARPANALARWSARRRRGMLHGLKGEMKEFRDAPDFWS